MVSPKIERLYQKPGTCVAQPVTGCGGAMGAFLSHTHTHTPCIWNICLYSTLTSQTNPDVGKNGIHGVIGFGTSFHPFEIGQIHFQIGEQAVN